MLTKHSIGLVVGRGGLWAVKTAKRNTRLTVVAAQSCNFSTEQKLPSATQLCAGFQALELESSPRLRVQVALPDPAVAIGVFKFKRVPRGRKACSDLLRLRFEDEYGIPANEIDIAYQPLGRASTDAGVFAVAARRAWLEPVRQALSSAGLIVHTIDAASCFRHNLLSPAIDPKRCGALLTVEADYWSLVLWQAGSVLTRMHAKWRHEAPSAGLDSIASEAMRWLRSALAECPGQEFACLYLSASEEEASVLQAACESRLTVVAKPFPMLWSTETGRHRGFPLSAIAAAVPR